MLHPLFAAGLVDELRFFVYPAILGHGKRLFDDKADASAFTLEKSESTAGGVLISRYVRGGEVRTATYE